MTEQEKKLAGNFRLAIDLHDTGVELMRQNLRRRFGGESPEEIDRRLAAWLRTRPGAAFGDAEGRPRPLQAPKKASR